MRFYLLSIVIIILLFFSCKNKNKDEVPEDQSTTTGANPPVNSDTNSVLGNNVLRKVKGIWNGPVSSTTPLGGYPEWIVDFRPISENQISAKNELDTANDIFMSFFVIKYNNQRKVAFRNGGSFVNMKRVSYFMADSVSETVNQSFYRFSEIVMGKSKAFTEVIRKGDSLIIKSYTNKYNTLTSASPHMTWRAKLQDTTSAVVSSDNFNFPKSSMTKDFSSTFTGQAEAVYYSTSGVPQGDPYPENLQPYLGQVTASYTFAAGFTPVSTKKVLQVITTQPLFNGFNFNITNLKYRSRYVILAANDLSYIYNYMHPGVYYFYALYDNDGNNTFNSGDWISTSNASFTLGAQSTASVNTIINLIIP